MGELQRLDGIDSRLLHALQIEPRASWHALAPIVGVDAATLARRWERLRSDGVVWAMGYAPPGQMALLELECEHGQLHAVSSALEADREAVVVDFTSGGRDILALVATADLASMSAYTVGRLGQVEGIRAVRTHLLNEILIEAASWRLRALTPAEVRLIPSPRPPRQRSAKRIPAELSAGILDELWRDARAPVATIAAHTGHSPQRVSDAIATLRARGELVLRTDIARTYSEWPVYAWYFIEAPARTIEVARKTITTIPEVRLAATAASRYNLILAVWLRRLTDINRLEIALTAAFEGARIADRSVVLQICKHMGRVIGLDGCAIRLADDAPSASRTTS